MTAPDGATWSGHRDRVMLTVLYNTGARVSEVTGLNVEDFQPASTGMLHLRGKGRKERVVPLWKQTTAAPKAWLKRIDTAVGRPLFPNRRSERLTRSGVRMRPERSLTIARETCRSLRDRRVCPHLLRHTTAMHLLQAGVDMTVIALWLGHESTSSTHMYVEADLTKKKRAIDKVPTRPALTAVTDRLCGATHNRKNSLFYKTENGAAVGDLFMSLIYTAELNRIDPFDYLAELQRNPTEMRTAPAQWMPWNYRDTLAAANTGTDPPS